MKIERGIQLNLNKLQPTDIEKNVNKKKKCLVVDNLMLEIF